jgi:hypothetical protein
MGMGRFCIELMVTCLEEESMRQHNKLLQRQGREVSIEGEGTVKVCGEREDVDSLMIMVGKHEPELWREYSKIKRQRKR